MEQAKRNEGRMHGLITPRSKSLPSRDLRMGGVFGHYGVGLGRVHTMRGPPEWSSASLEAPPCTRVLDHPSSFATVATLLQPQGEPGARATPLTLDHGRAEAEHFGDLGYGQASEVPQLDDASESRLPGGEVG